jgi:hypothetical protein
MRKRVAETWHGSAARLCRPRLVVLPMGLDRISSIASLQVGQVDWVSAVSAAGDSHQKIAMSIELHTFCHLHRSGTSGFQNQQIGAP